MNYYNNLYNYNNQIPKIVQYDYTDINKENLNTYNVFPNTNSIYPFYDGFIRGCMFQELYKPYKIEKPYRIEPLNEQARMLTDIDMLSFAAIDLSLYLDVHPNNKEMLEVFNKCREQLNKATVEYEKKFGPLSKGSSSNSNYPWQWENSPWPWEK